MTRVPPPPPLFIVGGDLSWDDMLGVGEDDVLFSSSSVAIDIAGRFLFSAVEAEEEDNVLSSPAISTMIRLQRYRRRVSMQPKSINGCCITSLRLDNTFRYRLKLYGRERYFSFHELIHQPGLGPLFG